MYQPPLFREDRLEIMHRLMETHPLGMLISVGAEGEPEANPVPMQLDRSVGELGVLKCHVARANQHWKMLAENGRVLVVFQGVDAYVSPSWYQTKIETGKVVPTWNYTMVQVRGIARVLDDKAWLGQQIRELTDHHEGKREKPWAVDDAPDAYIDSQIKGIVGIEIEILSIEGKWKVSQNRSDADRAGVVAGLHEDGNKAGAEEMAHLVESRGAK